MQPPLLYILIWVNAPAEENIEIQCPSERMLYIHLKKY